ncbi:MAG: hypothetical protein WCU88_08905 [Elusimicrobiota bacterium]
MFGLFNETDEVFASPDEFKTRKAARAYAREFRQRYKAQGYYLTAGGDRIPVEALRLVVVELGGGTG